MTDFHVHLVLAAELKHNLEAIAHRRGITLADVILESLHEKSAVKEQRMDAFRAPWTVSTEFFDLEPYPA